MDLDSNAYYKLCLPDRDDRYNEIIKAIHLLQHKHDNETPEMWCSRIRGPFRKILEENPEIFSKNGYIRIVCDSLVFIPERLIGEFLYRDGHLKRCITRVTSSIEHVRRKEILQAIDRRKFQIWQYKQYILQEEAEMKRLQLELSSQSTPHSEKDKLASVSYDYDGRSTGYKAYLSAKATIVKNTMPSAPNFEPANISPARQEMVLPTSYQSSNCKSNTSEIFISSRYAKQNNLLPSINNLNQPALRLKDGTKITFV